MVSIPDKINRLLAERGLMKRDLARALEVSPQTATDICKGRSAVTVAHLRRLITFFGLRADYWLDESRDKPTASDEVVQHLNEKVNKLSETGLMYVEDSAGFVRKLLRFVTDRRAEFIEQFGPPSSEERRLLGLPVHGQGTVGRIGGFPDEQASDVD